MKSFISKKKKKIKIHTYQELTYLHYGQLKVTVKQHEQQNPPKRNNVSLESHMIHLI
jgi:hypothetical protein